MELKLYIRDIEEGHLKEKSSYNNNYYKLPININGCNILFGKSDEMDSTLWALGKFVNDKFEVNCWLGMSYLFDEIEYIDLLQANKEMI